MDRTRAIIDFAYDDNGSEMRDALYAEIQDRVVAHIDSMKSEMAQTLFATEAYGTHEDDEEEKSDEKLIKKMVKKDALKSEAYDDDEDDDVARADRELARMKAKPIKPAKGIDPDKDISRLAKKTPKDELDESTDPVDEWDEEEEEDDWISENYSLDDIIDFMQTEEFAQLDELSKKTLGSYVKKSAGKLATASRLSRDLEKDAQRARNPVKKAGLQSVSRMFQDKAHKRRAGINMAADKLSKEEVDEALVGNQHKIDANKNKKIDAHDFKLLRNRKG